MQEEDNVEEALRLIDEESCLEISIERSNSNKRIHEKENLFEAFRKKIKHETFTSTTLNFNSNCSSSSSVKQTKKFLSSYENIPDTGLFREAVLDSGRSLYFKYSRPDLIKQQPTRTSELKTRNSNLLDRSVYQMMHELELEQRFSDNNRNIMSIPLDYCDDGSSWLEKYRPKKFCDLMGDDSLNEECLRWLKQWDTIVFPRALNKLKFNMKSMGKPIESAPFKKILLLHGPSGLGKTTLAHALGFHAGYNCIEINASDERTSSVLKDKVWSAIDSRSELFGKKPNLIILDEIDGISVGPNGKNSFLQSLIKLATSTSSSSSYGAHESISNSKKSKKKSTKTLLRPIICLCNDLYAPSLRELRMIAQVYQMKETPQAYMAKKLINIFQKEWKSFISMVQHLETLEVKIDPKTINYLVNESEGDWRVCLNTLESIFRNIKSKAIQETYSDSCVRVKMSDIEECLSVKQKSSNAFKVVEKIFNINQNEKEVKSNEEEARELQVELQSGVEEYDIILKFCFENYLHSKIRDLQFGYNYMKVYEMMNLNDAMMSKYSALSLLHEYQPFIVSAFCMYTRNVSNVRTYNKAYSERNGLFRLVFPKSENEARRIKKEKENIGQDLINGLRISKGGVNYRFWMNGSVVISSGIVDYLMKIITPKISTFNSHLLSKTEKERLERVQRIMESIGLNIRLEESTKDRVINLYHLDP